jgi:hypothetical protein
MQKVKIPKGNGWIVFSHKTPMKILWEKKNPDRKNNPIVFCWDNCFNV